ncbi:MAG: 1-phosphofructokinase family hexose kinase [Candidatus Dadabacteria bacterium]|nr:1-phosphofructokinase family hexose kinase [Candidatus Dadabacteria bacterium]
MKTVVTITMNPAIDKSTGVEVVAPEIKLRCGAPRFELGGGGINVSRALRELGGSSTALYTSGGYSGKLLESILNSEGIDHRPVRVDEMTRINLIVRETSTGKQYRFGMPGQPLTEEEWRKCLEMLCTVEPRPEFIVASGSLPPGVPEDFYAMVADAGGEIGAKTIVDTSGEPLRRVARKGVFMIKTNLREFGLLTGLEIKNNEELMSAATDVVEKGSAEVLVVSLGAEGAFGAWKGGNIYIASPEVPVRSAVGAGDSMVAGIVLKLAMDKSVEEALLMGVAAGAAAAMTAGSELCREEDAMKLYRQMLEG